MEEKVSQYEEKLKSINIEKTEKFDSLLEKYNSIENTINEMKEFFLKSKILLIIKKILMNNLVK